MSRKTKIEPRLSGDGTAVRWSVSATSFAESLPIAVSALPKDRVLIGDLGGPGVAFMIFSFIIIISR